MSKNNYFYYTDEHKDFLFYLLSFAMEQYKDEDSLLSECAKELIRYILGVGQKRKVVVTEVDEDIVTVNYDTFIEINTSISFQSWPKPEQETGDWYFVCYDPFALFEAEKRQGLNVVYLPMKKLKEIFEKYQGKNQILQQYIQFLDEQIKAIDTTLQTPIKQWDENDYRRFVLHLVEDSIIDSTRGFDGVWVYLEGNSQFTRSLHWYNISDDELQSMGVRDRLISITLYIRFNSINICFASSNDDDDPCIKKLDAFVHNICPMPIFFDLSNYKEKIQYAQSIMDRLVEEFRL